MKKVLPQNIFINSPEYQPWLQEVVDYVSAGVMKTPLYRDVEALAKDWQNQQHPESATRYMYRAYAFPESFVSPEFLVKLILKRGIGKPLPVGVIEDAFKFLESKGILYKQFAIRPAGPKPQNLLDDSLEYRPYDELLKYLISNGLLNNHLYGFPYIVNRYENSVVKIEVRHMVTEVIQAPVDDQPEKTEAVETTYERISLGTGWLLDLGHATDPNRHQRVVVTNEHVLAGCVSFRIITKDERTLTAGKVELLEAKTKADVAVIHVEQDPTLPSFTFNNFVDVLEEIITMGYPMVPMSRDAYQLVHRGEINAKVTDTMGNDLLIISARASPGNSGSPVVDDTGCVVGMVARELFEKEAFQSRGITPYFACIPAQVIMTALEQSDTWLQLQAEPNEA